MGRGRLLLGDLLDDARMGLQLLSGDGVEARNRPVLGAHSIELERPGRWLEPGWLVCTTGLVIHDQPAAQRTLVQELSALGAAALGFGVGVSVDAVPEALLDEAAAVGFPVLAIPEFLPFSDLISQVTCAVHDQEASITRRVQALQRYLFEAVGADDPRQELLRRLAEVTESAVALLDHDARPICSVGSSPPAALTAVLISGPRHIAEQRADGWVGASAPVPSSHRSAAERLVVARRGAALHPLTKPSIQSALATLKSVELLDSTRRGCDRVAREAVLQKLCSTSNEVLEHIADEQAAALGVDLRTGPVVVALAPRRPEAVSTPEVLHILQTGCEDAGVPYLATTYQRGVWAVLSASVESCRERIEAILATHGDLVGGIGRSVTSSSELRGALGEAHFGLERARADAGSQVENGSDLCLTALLLGGVDTRTLQARVTEMLAPIATSEPLLHTLETYFACTLNISQASRQLHLHPNSLRYRLARIEQLLQRPLRDPSTIADLHLAFTIRVLHAPSEETLVA